MLPKQSKACFGLESERGSDLMERRYSMKDGGSFDRAAHSFAKGAKIVRPRGRCKKSTPWGRKSGQAGNHTESGIERQCDIFSFEGSWDKNPALNS